MEDPRLVVDAPGGSRVTAGLPAPRGPLTERLFAAWGSGDASALVVTDGDVASADEDDLQLALYCSYELHYGGFAGVDPRWEWDPSHLAARRPMERRFEADLRSLAGVTGDAVGPPDAATPDAAVEAVIEAVASRLRGLADGDDEGSLSAWMRAHGTRSHLAELAVHRSAYQLKEADPHTWAIPRLAGEAKAALVTIQAGEYGDGDADGVHATLWARTMVALGLDPTPNAYLADLPAATLQTVNAMSLFGLHWRLRGALVGHLALFELTSVVPMRRYAAACCRLGLPAEARRFFEVHVQVDEAHGELAVRSLVGGLLRREPELAADVVLGAEVLKAVEAHFASQLMAGWRPGRLVVG